MTVTCQHSFFACPRPCCSGQLLQCLNNSSKTSNVCENDMERIVSETLSSILAKGLLCGCRQPCTSQTSGFDPQLLITQLTCAAKKAIEFLTTSMGSVGAGLINSCNSQNCSPCNTGTSCLSTTQSCCAASHSCDLSSTLSKCIQKSLTSALLSASDHGCYTNHPLNLGYDHLIKSVVQETLNSLKPAGLTSSG
jgi:hypothetical protein